jgi:replicative DNA helicase
MGKTSFAKGTQKHLIEQGKQVFYFDFVCNGKEIHKCFADFERDLRASEADFAVFDHFQFLSDYDETDETAERLFKKIKSLASELQIPIMVLLHLNRNPETRPDPSPVTTDIPHRKTILPFVDTVLLLYRRAYYDPFVDRNTARCIIDKAKRCHCKVLSLRWDDENYIFTD